MKVELAMLFLTAIDRILLIPFPDFFKHLANDVTLDSRERNGLLL